MLMASSTNNPIAAAAAGVEFSIGVTYQGQVLAWGSSEFGQVRSDSLVREGVRGHIPGTGASSGVN